MGSRAPVPLSFSRWGQRKDLQFQKSFMLILKDGLQHDGVGKVGWGLSRGLRTKKRGEKVLTWTFVNVLSKRALTSWFSWSAF